MQYFKNKNTDLQFTVTDRFCERLRQYTTLRPEFTKLFRLTDLGYDSFRIKEYKFSSKIRKLENGVVEIRKWALENCSCYLCRP